MKNKQTYYMQIKTTKHNTFLCLKGVGRSQSLNPTPTFYYVHSIYTGMSYEVIYIMYNTVDGCTTFSYTEELNATISVFEASVLLMTTFLYLMTYLIFEKQLQCLKV